MLTLKFHNFIRLFLLLSLIYRLAWEILYYLISAFCYFAWSSVWDMQREFNSIFHVLSACHNVRLVSVLQHCSVCQCTAGCFFFFFALLCHSQCSDHGFYSYVFFKFCIKIMHHNSSVCFERYLISLCFNNEIVSVWTISGTFTFSETQLGETKTVHSSWIICELLASVFLFMTKIPEVLF